MPADSRKSINYQSLDAWRGLAAMAVVVCHSCTPLLTNSAFGLARYAFYRDTVYGALGVQLFFVISGFCIASAAVRTSERGSGPLSFAKARIKRIYPPYLIATLLFIAYSLLAGFMYRHHLIGSISTPNGLHHSLKYFAASIFLLQVPMHYEPILTVTWTLCYEAAFYAIYAVLIFLSSKVKFDVLFAMALISIVSALLNIVLHVRSDFFPMDLLPQFGLGTAVFMYLRNPDQKRNLWMVAAIMGLLAIYGIEMNYAGDSIHMTPRVQSFFTIAFAGLLIFLYRLDAKLMQNRMILIFARVGVFSYTLYLVHDLFRGLVMQIGRKLHVTSADFWIETFLMLIISLIGARLLFEVMEKPFLNTPRVEPKITEIVTGAVPNPTAG